MSVRTLLIGPTQKLTLSEGWRDAARIAKGRKNGADELHTLATALEVILEEYEDGEFETLGELLDFHIDELKELWEAEREVARHLICFSP